MVNTSSLPNNDQSILGLLAAKKFTVLANTENKGTANPIVMANIFTKGQIEITQTKLIQTIHGDQNTLMDATS